jgi:hypothetical protein
MRLTFLQSEQGRVPTVLLYGRLKAAGQVFESATKEGAVCVSYRELFKLGAAVVNVQDGVKPLFASAFIPLQRRLQRNVEPNLKIENGKAAWVSSHIRGGGRGMEGADAPRSWVCAGHERCSRVRIYSP